MTAPDWINLAHNRLNLYTKQPPHCLLFIDPQQQNAFFTAQLFAAAVLCFHAHQGIACHDCQSCHLIERGTHPDAFFYPQPIKIEEIRALITKTTMTPALSARRVVFLGQIDDYSEEALNTLLKTLEEPSPHSLFILSARNRHAVKATIISRAHCISLVKPRFEDALAWLQEQGFSEKAATTALRYSHHDPYRAAQYLKNESFRPFELLTLLADFFAYPQEYCALLEVLEKIPAEHIVDVLTVHLEQLITIKQLDIVPPDWHNLRLVERLKPADLANMHRVYAKLCQLRRPNQRQLNLVLNAKIFLLELFNLRMKSL